MRNPSRTLQNSIFEPLYSHQEELPFQPNMPNTQSSSSSSSSSDNWLSLNPPFSIAPLSSKATMKRASATIFNENISGEESCSDAMATESAHSVMATERELPSTCDLGMCSPSGSSSVITPTSPLIRSCSSSDVVNPDDGSVASKLLSSITKSISSPSLLACCKESARETPYQKSLRLRTMKLQYCAEELGSESSEGSLHGGNYFNNNIFDSLNKMSSSQSTRDFSAEYQKNEGNSASSKLISVRSSPNLGCSSLVSKPTSHIRERSFPPPLSHTLPRSASLDSFSYSLRASREDGRFVLKEFKVPCRQYFQASREDGRLTLQRLTSSDEDSESTPTEAQDLQEDDNIGVYIAGASGDVGASDKAKDGSKDQVEVEYAKNTANLAGGLEVCRVKGSKKSVDDTDEKNNMKEAGCLYAECFLMGKTLSNGDSCSAKINDKANFLSLGDASSKMKSDFKAAKRKTTSKASRIRSSSSRHLLSSSSNRQSLLHLPGKSSNLKLGHDFDATKLSQCAENLGLESKSTSGVSTGGGTTLQGFEITPASLRTSGYGIGKSPSSTIIFKDMSAKCLMENVSKLVASFGLAECGRKWSCEEKERGLDKNSYRNSGGIMENSMYMGIKSINIGVREIESRRSHELIHGVLVDVHSCERGFRYGAFREGKCDVVDDSTRSYLQGSSFHFGVEIPPSSTDSRAAPPLASQGTEWLHTLHCKEIFHRNLAKGAFMKLHCVA